MFDWIHTRRLSTLVFSLISKPIFKDNFRFKEDIAKSICGTKKIRIVKVIKKRENESTLWWRKIFFLNFFGLFLSKRWLTTTWFMGVEIALMKCKYVLRIGNQSSEY